MPRRLRPQFHAGMTPAASADALNRMADDLYRLVGGFTGSPPMQVEEVIGGGYHISIDLKKEQFVAITGISANTTYIGRQVKDGVLNSGNTNLASAKANFTSKDVGATLVGAGIYGPRTITDGVENSTTTLTSATANFTSADVGQKVVGAGIPAGTTISSVTNSTTVIMSAAATQTVTGVTIVIGQYTKVSAFVNGTNVTMSKAATANETADNVIIATGVLTVYPAILAIWNNVTGQFDETTVVWWYGVNTPTCANAPENGDIYQCRFLGVDVNGVMIWATSVVIGIDFTLKTPIATAVSFDATACVMHTTIQTLNLVFSCGSLTQGSLV